MKIKAENLSVNDKFALRLSIKAINDTCGPSGIYPSMIVYVIQPAVPALNREIPTHTERMESLVNAQREMATIHAENRIQRALNSKILPDNKYRFEVGDSVRVYREQIRRWEGRFTIIDWRERWYGFWMKKK